MNKETFNQPERQLLIGESQKLSVELTSILDEEEKLDVQVLESESPEEIEKIIERLGSLNSQKRSNLERKIEILGRLQEIDSNK